MLFTLNKKYVLRPYYIKILYIYIMMSLLYKMEFQEKGFMISPICSKLTQQFL